jgi:hypothetical protein
MDPAVGLDVAAVHPGGVERQGQCTGAVDGDHAAAAAELA